MISAPKTANPKQVTLNGFSSANISLTIIYIKIIMFDIFLNVDNTPLGREDYLLTTDEMRDNDYPSPEPVTVNHHGAGETKDNGMNEKKCSTNMNRLFQSCLE